MADQSPNVLMQFIIPYALIILVFYLLVFKPQRDQRNQLKKTIAGLKKNDEIVTSGGIHGTVVNIKDTTVVIRIDDAAKMEIDKDAVTAVTKSSNS